MAGLLATLLNWVLGLFGVGKPDPVRDARRETAAKVRAEDRAAGLEKALKGTSAIQAAQKEVRDREENKPSGPIGPGTNLFNP